MVAVAGLGVWKYTSSGEPAASNQAPPQPPSQTAATEPAAASPPPAPTPATQSPVPAKHKPAPFNEPLPKERTWQCIGTNPNAPIKIEVFSDYQCPACRTFYIEISRQLIADYAATGKVCLVYHEFPLKGHQYSRQAAHFAEAAARLGPQQWIKVTDALFYYQAQWSTDGQVEATVAKALTESEMNLVRRLVDDPAIDAVVERDLEEGGRRGVRSTPTAFILTTGREERIPPGVQYPILRRVLDGLLQGK